MYLTHGSRAGSVEGFGDRDGRRGARGTEDHREVSGIGDSSESLVGSDPGDITGNKEPLTGRADAAPHDGRRPGRGQQGAGCQRRFPVITARSMECASEPGGIAAGLPAASFARRGRGGAGRSHRAVPYLRRQLRSLGRHSRAALALAGLIAKIFRGQNEEERYRSPLTEIGIDVREGDYVLAIDGQELLGTDNPYRLLLHKADRPVQLTTNDKPTLDGARRVYFRPITSETNLIYLDWVTRNREKVTAMTDGRVGYLHLPDMAANGIREFFKYFFGQIRKEGLMVKSRVVCKSERKLLDASVRLPWRPPSVREA